MRFWCDAGFADQAGQIIASHDDSIVLQRIVAGKFRRYHHLTLLQHLMIPSIVLLNIRDLFLIIVGFIQSLVRMLVWRPDVVFSKGGFVCLPVGWAAWCLRIPLVLHDSDVVPGLTSRLLAGKATAIATGAPLEHYPYDKAKSRYVGIPIDAAFVPYSDAQRQRAKQILGVAVDRPLVVVIGGGLGSGPLNDVTAAHIDDITADASLLLLSGKVLYEDLRKRVPANSTQFQLHAFISSGIVDVLGAADVVVSRAGATALLELAALRAPTILVPSSRLTWQMKHAQLYADEGAVLLLDETKFDQVGDTSFISAVHSLIGDSAQRGRLSEAIGQFAMPNAAKDMADMIEASVESVKKSPKAS